MNQVFPDFHLPTKLFIRPGIIDNTDQIISDYGSRAILVTTSKDFEKLEQNIVTISDKIKEANISCVIYDEIPGVPNSEYIDSAVYFAKKTNCDLIIGFGGLDSINAAKAIALLTNNSIFCDDLFSKPKVAKPVNLITIPTHPIFGFEILPLFFVTDIHTLHKKAYWNDFLYPQATIIDPELSLTANDDQIASLGISTLAISAESIISKKYNEFTDTYALKSIDLTFKHVVGAYKDPFNTNPRFPLAIASVLAGVAFSRSYLSLCLAISMALSSYTKISIENAMCVILPHIMEYNLTASPSRYVQMSKVMEEDVKDITVIEAAIKAVEAIRRIEQELDIKQRLSEYNVAKSDFSLIAELAMSYPFLKGAARKLNKNEIETILIAAH